MSEAPVTEWASDTVLVCKVAAGVAVSIGVALTSGGGLSSTVSALISYDSGMVTGLAGSNAEQSAGTSISILGTGFGSNRLGGEVCGGTTSFCTS